MQKYIDEKDVSETYSKIEKQMAKEINELIEEGGYVGA